MRYNNFSAWLKQRYPGKVKKVCIDGGFTCPNRDGSCGTGGCIFCGERGAGDHIEFADSSVAEQVAGFLKRHPEADSFIAYFQSFSNTYAPVDVLKRRYDAAVIDGRTAALAVATRPDCINAENADLLASYKSRCDVWVELGLQTSNEQTARLINRGYPLSEFERAVRLLGERDIPVVVHIMAGLPSETAETFAETVRYLGRFRISGIKLHSLYVMKNTALERIYKEGSYTPLTRSEYARLAADALTHIRPEVVIHRLVGSCTPDLLVSPEWVSDKDRALEEINRILESEDLAQGCFCDIPDVRLKY
ncbi:MAG: TIGR01212 family radical SAM protein [Ruminococcus sp.]|nr:TIGR01212 family radical SAM protein [Ruminococcus sp.]